MPSTLEINQKINSLGNIQKVTRAMNMIASIRLRKLASAQTALHLFEDELNQMVQTALPVLDEESDPLVVGFGTIRKVQIILFTADRGLCGSHNHFVHKALDRLAANLVAGGKTVEVTCLGTKGGNYARRKGYEVFHQAEIKEVLSRPSELSALADKVLHRFISEEVQAVFLIFNRFLSTIRQETTELPVLPFSLLEKPESRKASVKLTLDPGVEPFLLDAGPLLFRYFLATALAHSAIGEQAARMTAMDNASKNARELTNRSIKERNRVRQAGITNELIEIISGKEAMKR